jgi:hypothetical protein
VRRLARLPFRTFQGPLRDPAPLRGRRRLPEPFPRREQPEQKRLLIGAKIIVVFREEAEQLGTIPFLAQGTLYPEHLVPRAVRDDQDVPQRGWAAEGPGRRRLYKGGCGSDGIRTRVSSGIE